MRRSLLTVGLAFGLAAWQLQAADPKPSAEQVEFFETKVRPILGALRGGFLTTLVTDQATAESVLALADAEPVA